MVVSLSGVLARIGLLFIGNDSTSKRTPFPAAISTDGGRAFAYRTNLFEGEDAFAHPSAVQTDERKIHLVFCAQGRTEIYHSTFEERDISEVVR